MGWRQWLERYAADIDTPTMHSFDQEHHAIHAAMAGQGIVLCSSIPVSTALQHGWLVELEPKRRLPGFVHYVETAPGRQDHPALAAFTEWVTRQFAGGSDQRSIRRSRARAG